MIRSVAVYLGSKPGNNPIFVENARAIGKALATNGYPIIYGGAAVGTMKELADGAMECGGEVIGVFPANFKGKKEVRDAGIEVKHSGLTKMIEVKDMQERKKVMEELSDCCIILPGSFGTMDELFEYTVNRQLEKHLKHIVILNTNGFYSPIKELINNMINNGFLPAKEREIVVFCDTVNEVIEYIRSK